MPAVRTGRMRQPIGPYKNVERSAPLLLLVHCEATRAECVHMQGQGLHVNHMPTAVAKPVPRREPPGPVEAIVAADAGTAVATPLQEHQSNKPAKKGPVQVCQGCLGHIGACACTLTRRARPPCTRRPEAAARHSREKNRAACPSPPPARSTPLLQGGWVARPPAHCMAAAREPPSRRRRSATRRRHQLGWRPEASPSSSSSAAALNCG